MLRPLETLAGVVYAGLATCAITRAVAIYASYQLYALFANAGTDGYGNPIGVDIAQAERMDMFQAAIAIAVLLFLIGTGVPYLMWLWRAKSNLAVLSKVKQKYEPSMAVAGWFIPFLNLVRPHQVVQELHDTSLSAAKDAGVRLDAAPVGPLSAGRWRGGVAGDDQEDQAPGREHHDPGP